MPKLEALHGIPSFGSQLGQALGGGLTQGINSALSQMLEQKSQQRKTQDLLNALGISSTNTPSETITESLEFSPKTPKPNLKNLSQEEILAASIMNPQLAPVLGNIYKNQQKENKENESKEVAQESLNRMSELLSEGKLGFGSKLKSKAFGGKTAEAVGEFESLSGALESLLVDKVSRGTLSNARFKYITETLLPKPNDREATIKGKLKALSKELKLDLPSSFGKKTLDTETAQSFLEQAGGNKEKARKIAKAKGYSF